MIKEFLQRQREKKDLQRYAENEYSINHKLIEKRKSANERELEKYKEAQKSPETNDLIDQKNNLKETYNSYKNMKNSEILNNS